jgi:hypothetical protein
MGVWGYGGLESDTAFELIESVIVKVRSTLKKKISCGDDERTARVRAAAERRRR